MTVSLTREQSQHDASLVFQFVLLLWCYHNIVVAMSMSAPCVAMEFAATPPILHTCIAWWGMHFSGCNVCVCKSSCLRIEAIDRPPGLDVNAAAVLVTRNGHVYELNVGRNLTALEEVLMVRSALLRKAGVHGPWLPFLFQQEGHRLLLASWLERPSTQPFIRQAPHHEETNWVSVAWYWSGQFVVGRSSLPWHRCAIAMRLPTASVACFIIDLQQVSARAADRDQYARDLRSLYRKSQLEEFGGREWQHILLAIGDVNEEMVTIVNTIVQERTAESLLQKRGARAVPRDQRTQQAVQGINHRISEAKLARSQAKQLDKIVTKEYAQHEQGTSWMSWPDWNRLLENQKAVASTS